MEGRMDIGSMASPKLKKTSLESPSKSTISRSQRSRRQISSATCSAAALVLLLSCSSVACSPTQRENADATNATLGYLEATYGALQNPLLDAMLRRVSQRLVRAQLGLKGFAEYRGLNHGRIATIPWQIHVIDDSTPNAFAIGSGVVVVTRAMILSLESEAELAAVISHEMSHELLGHTVSVLSLSATENNLAQYYDIEQEIAADRLSVLLLHAAGYPPEASVEALTRVQSSLKMAQGARAEGQHYSRRISALELKLQSLPMNRPYFRNTREYNKVRRSVHRS